MATRIAPTNHSPLADAEALHKAFKGCIISIFISYFFTAPLKILDDRDSDSMNVSLFGKYYRFFFVVLIHAK